MFVATVIPRMSCDVLIVEDDADLREMMAQILALEGFTPATANNGRDALDYLRAAELPRLILLDLMMPVMDGWEFQRERQRDPRLAALPVLVLTALDEARASDATTDGYMKKPLDFDTLLNVVHRYCRTA